MVRVSITQMTRDGARMTQQLQMHIVPRVGEYVEIEEDLKNKRSRMTGEVRVVSHVFDPTHDVIIELRSQP